MLIAAALVYPTLSGCSNDSPAATESSAINEQTRTPAPAAAPAAPAAAIPAPAKPAGPAAVEGPTINAPLNGTFYRSSAPGKPELSKEGDSLKAGDPLCIVEAMKLFNQIKADRPLTVVKFLVEHGAVVAKGQPLAAVKY